MKCLILMLLIGLYMLFPQECTAAQQFLPSNHVFKQQGDKIQHSYGGHIGLGVAITADGKTLFASISSEEDNQIGMLVDSRANATEEQFVLNSFVEALANSNSTKDYPTSIATSDDGSTVALLSVNASHEFVHILSGPLWLNTRTFAFEKNASTVEMPPSIAISGNGQTIVYGSGSIPDVPVQPGCAQIFRLIGGVWNITELPLTGVQTEDFIKQRRCQVDISRNGNTVLVGLPWINQGMGGVLVFMKKRGNTYSQVSKLVPLEQALGVGDQLAVNSDGNIAVAFSQIADTRRGGFWAFQQHPYIAEQWFPLAGMYTIKDPTLLPIFIGSGLDGPFVAKMGADETIAIGQSTYDSNKGGVWLFRRKDGPSPSWEQVDQRLDPVGEIDEVQFGSSLAFSQEGTLVVGARDSSSTGSVWVFRATQGNATISTQSPFAVGGEENEALVISSTLAGVFGGLLLVTWLAVAIVYHQRRINSDVRNTNSIAFGENPNLNGSLGEKEQNV